MNNTKDKVKDGQFKLVEALSQIDLMKYIGKAQDEMSKNSIESSIDEYDSIHIKDDVYLSLISEMKTYIDIRTSEYTKISSNDNISQEERNYILNYIKSELDPLIKEKIIEVDTRRSEINLDRKDYVKESDEKKTPGKNAMLGLSLGTSALFAYPKTRKIIIDGGKKLVDGAIKKGTKLL
ncbi:MAG: hypothetical protein ACRCX2_28190 [Paraclostridium sp.]